MYFIAVIHLKRLCFNYVFYTFIIYYLGYHCTITAPFLRQFFFSGSSVLDSLFSVRLLARQLNYLNRKLFPYFSAHLALWAEIPFQNPLQQQDGKVQVSTNFSFKTKANKISSIFHCSPWGAGNPKQQKQKLAKLRTKRKFRVVKEEEKLGMYLPPRLHLETPMIYIF